MAFVTAEWGLLFSKIDPFYVLLYIYYYCTIYRLIHLPSSDY